MFRDFIYLDINRVQSIIAQLQEGLMNDVMEGKTEQTTDKAQMVVNLLAMLLPISISGAMEHGRGTSISESKVLHDYAFEVARLSLEEGGFLLERDDLGRGEVPESGFVLVRGAAQVLDYETLQRVAENFDRLDDFFNSDDTPAQKKKRRKENRPFRESSVLIETFFKDAIRVKVVNGRGCSFVGPLDREHLREDVRGLIYKHGSLPKGEWAMLAEISRVPSSDEDAEESFEDMMEQLNEQAEASVSNQIDQVVTMFNGLQQFLGSVTYPDIAVSPIAVYREIEGRG